VAGKKKHRKPRSQRRRMSRGNGRTGADMPLLRLVICGVLFVLLVAVKVLFPQALGELSAAAGTLLIRDADFTEAFAAVGRAVSGEESVGDSLEDAYQAVFHPRQIPATRTVSRPSPASEGVVLSPGEAIRTLPLVHPLKQPGVEELLALTVEEETAPEAEGEGLYAAISVPDNASLELRDLGFDSCTPVVGAVTSLFGWREHPISGGSKFHYGVDVAAPSGAAISAFADGSVYATGESSTLGKYIMLRHRDGYVSLYAHCSKVLKTSGEVAMGETIAEVGATGTATGPHLHFELQNGSVYLNPLYYLDVTL